MKALITGASSGIGRDMAINLANRGIDLILVARRKDRLEELKKLLNVDVEIIPLDISAKENCYSLYEKVKDKSRGLLIYQIFLNRSDFENDNIPYYHQTLGRPCHVPLWYGNYG